jgi:hypothetical protein
MRKYTGNIGWYPGIGWGYSTWSAPQDPVADESVPGCGGRQWLAGRSLIFCSMILPETNIYDIRGITIFVIGAGGWGLCIKSLSITYFHKIYPMTFPLCFSEDFPNQQVTSPRCWPHSQWRGTTGASAENDTRYQVAIPMSCPHQSWQNLETTDKANKN